MQKVDGTFSDEELKKGIEQDAAHAYDALSTVNSDSV